MLGLYWQRIVLRSVVWAGHKLCVFRFRIVDAIAYHQPASQAHGVIPAEHSQMRIQY